MGERRPAKRKEQVEQEEQDKRTDRLSWPSVAEEILEGGESYREKANKGEGREGPAASGCCGSQLSITAELRIAVGHWSCHTRLAEFDWLDGCVAVVRRYQST